MSKMEGQMKQKWAKRKTETGISIGKTGRVNRRMGESRTCSRQETLQYENMHTPCK